MCCTLWPASPASSVGIYGLFGRRQSDWNEVLRVRDFNSMMRVPTHHKGWTYLLAALSSLVLYWLYPFGYFAWITGINVFLCAGLASGRGFDSEKSDL